MSNYSLTFGLRANSSKGNQACGMAFASQYLQIQCVVFVPSPVPLSKIKYIQESGKQYVTIKQEGYKLSESIQLAQQYAEENNMIFIDFSDIEIVEGVGSMGFEILDDIKEPDIDYVLFNSVTASITQGLGSFIRQMYPDTKIIGVEPDRAGYESQQSNLIGNFQNLFDESSTLKKPTNQLQTTSITSPYYDEKIIIDDGLACKFVTLLYDSEGIVIEPDSAIVPAALEMLKDKIKNKVVLCIMSGHRTDLSRLGEIRTISNVYDKKEFYMLINFFRKHGAFKEFLNDVLTPEDDLLRVEYTRKNNREKGPALVGIQSSDLYAYERISSKLTEKGIDYKKINPQDDLFKLKV